ncbi:MAG: DUF4111 domain-containing protein [Chloroflexota bacterium]|nr:DUF4111 domain-containing protein [Chloroflexota bacterium]
MPELLQPTPYSDVNEVLHAFAIGLQTIIGDPFRGMYLSGSLALGDFDPRTSDIDFIVLTDVALSADLVEGLADMHGRFDASGSPWAGRIEVVYITPEVLRSNRVSTTHYPQVEKGGPLFVAPLEGGWIFHLYTLWEHGITVVGSAVRPLIDSVDPDEMRRAAAPIAELWMEQARNDPGWIEWLHEREHQSFVVLTLCRLLYTLELGAVASKPAAARWAQQALGPHWAPLIAQALTKQHCSGKATKRDITDTIAFLHYAVDRFQHWSNTRPPAP